MPNHTKRTSASVDLYWLPLGAGDSTHRVRVNGRVLEAAAARHEHRASCDLYHAALAVGLDGQSFIIEMAPAWGDGRARPRRRVRGPGGAALAGSLPLLPLRGPTVARWVTPDAAEAVDSPQLLSGDPVMAQQILDLAPTFPAATWGRDELRAGDMWSSNSLVAWLLVRSGHDMDAIGPPERGRAPGWLAGLVVAARSAPAPRRQALVDAAPGH